jgi:hypothetical protein
MSSTVKAQVMAQLDILPEDLQQQVLEFVQALQVFTQRGIPGKELLQFAGTIPLDDLELMRQPSTPATATPPGNGHSPSRPAR